MENRPFQPVDGLMQSWSMEKVDEQVIRQAGLKVTLPRMKILEILQRNPARHMSAEDVYKMLLANDEDIGLATVYRVLTQFEAAGLVERHHFEGGQAVFEMNRGEHHDHIICMTCGKVEEFVDKTIEHCQARIAREKGYHIKDHTLILYGECMNPDCPNRPAPE